MAWTYEANPAEIVRDEVRFLIGDTDENDQQIQDEEISYALATYNDNAYKAGALCCTAIASKYARFADSQVDEVKIGSSEKYRHYLALAATLEQKAETAVAGGFGTPYVGGVSVSDTDSNKANTDRVEPLFERTMFNNPPGSVRNEFLSS